LGLLEDRRGGDFSASRAVLRIARQDTTNPQRLTRALMGRCSKAELAWEDFAHLGPERALAEHLLRAALARREQGIGILLHGGPGTGKTAFARTLAERLEVHAVFVGETDESDAEPSRNDRIAAYALARALAGRTGRTILVVDEADDVFTGVDKDDAESRRGSKVFMNRLVEKTEAPTIWITNNPERLGPAVMRRMTLAIRFPQPGRTVRRTILNRTLKRRKLRLPARDIERLVRIETAPAILDSAVRAAKLTHGGADDVEIAARSIVRVLEGAEPPRLPEIEGLAFDPALCSADADLDVLTEQVARSRDLALSFCFYGLPGTGKSAFARHLAERLGVDVIEKRASDLLSMWAGETEKQIARAFEEAADRRAMLILDEADSLLRDRAGARQSWEVTQVNEMLTWMERHPYPVACTTNLMESLDPATLRRFLFKVRFLPMTVSQAREAFRRTFGLEPPRSLDQLDPLTPGDFAVVARKARVLGETGPERLGRLLATEVQLKPGVARQRIGF
jgi:SpoVK/Ycf46/Vps4 family AAA+-type ATPase